MATADIEKRDWGHKLFSNQHCGELIMKVVKIADVVRKFIDSGTISEAEKTALADMKVVDQKFRYLLGIITKYCKGNDLGALKTFIDILGDTNNVAIAQQLSLIHDERVNHAETLSQLSKEESLVEKLRNEIRRLQSILEEKERHIERLNNEKNKLVDHYRVIADEPNKTLREKNLSLEKQINKKKEDLLFVEKEMGELTSKKNVLENEVELKSNVVRKRNKEIVEKERELWEAIEESNRLRLKCDTLQKQHSESMVKDKDMSKKIGKLEDEITEQENTIMNLRKNKTMKRGEVEEIIGNINKGHEKILEKINENFDNQKAMMKEEMAAFMRGLSLKEQNK